jgi:DnaK suppressor protein
MNAKSLPSEVDPPEVDLDAARERLLGMQHDLRSTIEDLTARLESGSTPDAAEGGQDTGDLGAHEQQAAENEGLLDGARRRLDSVGDALKRIEDGTYGRSIVSGEPIPAERLEALPDAATLAGEKL